MRHRGLCPVGDGSMLTLLTCWAKGKDLRNHAMVERDLQYSATELFLI